jgi:CRP/FNR family transcriptional regulator, cyclic AMP receptor protein
MPSTAEHLASVPFFALLDDEERKILAAQVDIVNFDEKAQIFETGEPGDALFVVLKGAVEIYFKNDTGERIVLEVARAGDFFGEISLLDGGPRTAAAVTIEEVEALVVDRHDLDELLKRKPGAALDLLTATGRRLRQTAELLRHTASRNVNEEEDHDAGGRIMRIADVITEFSGSLTFLFIHIGFFALWIGLNAGAHPIGGFDPYPFGFLTLVVSLEAIILSVFVLLSQNRQSARDRLRNDIEYDVNLKSELEIGHLHEKVDRFYADTLARLARIERATGATPPSSSTPRSVK